MNCASTPSTAQELARTGVGPEVLTETIEREERTTRQTGRLFKRTVTEVRRSEEVVECLRGWRLWSQIMILAESHSKGVQTALVDEGLTVAEKIPAVEAQMVIFQSDNISSVQRAYSALNTLGFWLPIVANILALIGVFAAVNSRRALIGFGVGLTIAMFAQQQPALIR